MVETRAPHATAPPARLELRPAHLVRVGTGPVAVGLRTRGHGLVLGSFGVRRSRGGLDVRVLSRPRSERAWALFVGLHGVAWASTRLPAPSTATPPALGRVRLPLLPKRSTPPPLGLQLSVHPPEPP